jgi:hypothetical protein
MKRMGTLHTKHQPFTFRLSLLVTLCGALCGALCACGNVFSSLSEAGIAANTQISSLIANPLRKEYALSGPTALAANRFSPATDLQVLALYPNGAIREVPIEDVTVFCESSNALVEDAIVFTSTDDLGEWRFVVRYKDKSAPFVFFVRTKLEEEVLPASPGGIDIGIKWKKD